LKKSKERLVRGRKNELVLALNTNARERGYLRPLQLQDTKITAKKVAA
jgi:hypothetical protein